MIVKQKNIDEMDKRDATSYKFDLLENILEGMYKIRFKLLYTITYLIENNKIIDSKIIGFGEMINLFPARFINQAKLYLKDPLFAININQWRNIAAHKSYEVKIDKINLEYANKSKISITHEEFEIIGDWIIGVYNALRLAEIITYFNYIPELNKMFTIKNNRPMRFDALIFEMIFNMTVIGFKFKSTSETDNTFSIIFEKNEEKDLLKSIIHVSQCLDRIAFYLSLDDFYKDNYKFVSAKIEEENEIKAVAKVNIKTALQKVRREITRDEYMNAIEFIFK
jgi:hypothetical protein